VFPWKSKTTKEEVEEEEEGINENKKIKIKPKRTKLIKNNNRKNEHNKRR
jgi:hypothetical protein